MSSKAVEKMVLVELKKELPAFEHRSRLYEIFRKIKIDAERLPTKIIFRVIGLRLYSLIGQILRAERIHDRMFDFSNLRK